MVVNFKISSWTKNFLRIFSLPLIYKNLQNLLKCGGKNATEIVRSNRNLITDHELNTYPAVN